jgi:hypothetical protein
VAYEAKHVAQGEFLSLLKRPSVSQSVDAMHPLVILRNPRACIGQGGYSNFRSTLTDIQPGAFLRLPPCRNGGADTLFSKGASCSLQRTSTVLPTG